VLEETFARSSWLGDDDDDDDKDEDAPSKDLAAATVNSVLRLLQSPTGQVRFVSTCFDNGVSAAEVVVDSFLLRKIIVVRC